jgi:YidC/Oxa1 family membrane protein insertase
MDKRTLIITISLSLAVITLWMAFLSWYDRHYPPTVATNTTEPAATQPAEALPSTMPVAGAPTTNSTTQPASAPSLAAGFHAVAPLQGVSPVTLGSDRKQGKEPVYALQLKLTPNGAGISEVVLNDFKQDVKKPDPYTFEKPYDGSPNTAPLMTRSLKINGHEVPMDSVPWQLAHSDETTATYTVQIAGPDGPAAEVTKTYRIFTKAAAQDKGQGFEINVEQNVRNLTDHPMTVQAEVNGPTQPPRETLRGGDRAIVAGYGLPANKIEVAHHYIEEYKPGKETIDVTSQDNHHAVWAGEGSTYFDAIVLFEPAGSAQYTVTTESLEPNSEDRNVRMTLQSQTLTVAPGGQGSLPLSVFLGPKSRGVLGSSYFSQWPRDYSALLVVTSGTCGWCTFVKLIDVLVAVLRFFHLVFRDWGLAIICLVVLVRLILHPITKRSQVQMMKMGKMGPEIERLKKKYGDDKDALNKEMMRFYKEQGSTPILGCLPMFLQMPIWIALWQALQSTFELRQAPFLYGLTWIKDLAKPDALITFPHPIPLLFFGWQLHEINLLPLLMCVVTYINMKYFTPMPPAATPEQEQQQKMQRGLSMVFPLMFYPFPSGLNLYYLTSTSLGIIEGKIIRDHIKEREEAEKAGKVFVSTKATRAARNRGEKEGEQPTGGIWGWVEKMQARAEQLRNNPSDRNKRGNR